MSKGQATVKDLDKWISDCETWAEELRKTKLDLELVPGQTVAFDSSKAWERMQNEMERVLFGVQGAILRQKLQRLSGPEGNGTDAAPPAEEKKEEKKNQKKRRKPPTSE